MVEITNNENQSEDATILIQEVDVEEEYELVDVFVEDGVEFFFDDLVNDFNIFCDYMFKRLGFKEPTFVQKKMINFLHEPNEKDKMIQGMRGIGKSMLSQLYVLWRLLRNNDEHILVRSASSKRSRNYTTFLLNLIKQTPILQHMAPTNKHRKSSELFDVNGSKASDSPNVLSAGISANVTGLRATLEILDDVEVVANSSNPDTRETLNEQINENINLLVESNGISGEVIILGTFQSSDSVYVPMIHSGAYDTFIVPSEYVEIDSWYKGILAPFVEEAVLKDPSLIGQAIDTRFTMEVLNKRKLRIGKSNYALHYLLNPILQDSLRFPLKMKDMMVYDIDPIDNPIRFVYSSEDILPKLKHRGFTGDFTTKPAWLSDERLPFEFTILAIDPSGRGSDETGWVVVSFMGGKVFIRDFGGLDGGYEDETLNTLTAIAVKYDVNRVTVESNFGDGAYLKMLEAKLISVHPCETKDYRAVGQKEVRIIDTLEPLMNQHRIIISKEALEKDFAKSPQYSLTYQMTHLTKVKGCLTHDDIIDVFELGVRDLIEFMGRDDKTAMDKYKESKKIDFEKFMQKNALVPALHQGGSKANCIQDNY